MSNDMSLGTINAFSKSVGLDNVKWESRGGGKQYVSEIYQDETSAKRIATAMNQALKQVDPDPNVAGETIRTVASSSGGYRVLVDHAAMHDLFFKDYLEKNKSK